PEGVGGWVRQHERDPGGGDGGLTTAERQLLKELERENRELGRGVYGNDIRAGCSGAGVMGPSTVRHSPSQ
ncbi:hypothetical protein CWM40_28730, partial [Escherichia coli]